MLEQWERIKKLLAERLGDNWREQANVSLSCADWSWIVMLVEEGIASMSRTWKRNQQTNRLGVEEMCSLADWKMTLEKIVDQIVAPKKS
jgi:hypothetical protein